MKDYYENDSNFQPGERVMAFDSLLWMRNGGDSKQDSFMRSGTIVAVYREKQRDATPPNDLRILADIKFDHRENVSKGHFLYPLERICTTT